MGATTCVLEVKGRQPMRPPLWQPSVDLSPAEQTIIKRIKRAKLFVFLRQHRHILFDAAFQDELATILGLTQLRPTGGTLAGSHRAESRTAVQQHE